MPGTIVEFASNGKPVRAYLAAAASGGPGVIVLQ